MRYCFARRNAIGKATTAVTTETSKLTRNISGVKPFIEAEEMSVITNKRAKTLAPVVPTAMNTQVQNRMLCVVGDSNVFGSCGSNARPHSGQRCSVRFERSY